jgi:hypothetical protein
MPGKKWFEPAEFTKTIGLGILCELCVKHKQRLYHVQDSGFCQSTKGPKYESRKMRAKHPDRDNTRKRHPEIFYNLVLSEISPARLNLFTFNPGVFLFSSLRKATFDIRIWHVD